MPDFTPAALKIAPNACYNQTTGSPSNPFTAFNLRHPHGKENRNKQGSFRDSD